MKVRVTVLIVCVALASSWWMFEQQRTLTIVVTNDAKIILPEQVTLIAGLRDTLIIRNETQEAILLVGRPIGPNQQIRQRYRIPGTYQSVCTSHGSASMDVLVKPFDFLQWIHMMTT